MIFVIHIWISVLINVLVHSVTKIYKWRGRSGAMCVQSISININRFHTRMLSYLQIEKHIKARNCFAQCSPTNNILSNPKISSFGFCPLLCSSIGWKVSKMDKFCEILWFHLIRIGDESKLQPRSFTDNLYSLAFWSVVICLWGAGLGLLWWSPSTLVCMDTK